MKNTFGITLLRNFYLDTSIKWFAFLSVFQFYYPSNIAALILTVTAVLLAVRFLLWEPLKGFSNFGIGLSYLGYLGLIGKTLGELTLFVSFCLNCFKK